MRAKRFFDEMEVRGLGVSDRGDYYVVYDYKGDIVEISKTEVGRFIIRNRGDDGLDCDTVKNIINICIDFSYTPINERGQVVYAIIARTHKDDGTIISKFYGVFSTIEKAEDEVKNIRSTEAISDEQVHEIEVDGDESIFIGIVSERRFYSE